MDASHSATNANTTRFLKDFLVPDEIWNQIIDTVSHELLWSITLSSRDLHRCANPRLYQSVQFIGTKKSLNKFGEERYGRDEYLNPINPLIVGSSLIRKPTSFLKAIQQSSVLRFYINEAIFSWDETASKEDIRCTQKILELLNPSITRLHLAPANFDVELSFLTGVTSLYLPYFDVQNYMQRDAAYLCPTLYAIFCIPTLRHLTLDNTRTWENSNVPLWLNVNGSDRARTSGVLSLSLTRSTSMSFDLKEILTWPRALKSITHQIATEEDTSEDTSAEDFLAGVYCQRHSLEEISYNNRPRNEEVEVTPVSFGGALREFSSLKRLCVPRNCLVMTQVERYFYEHTLPSLSLQDYGRTLSGLSLWEVLPPNIEELIVELEGDFKWGCWEYMDTYDNGSSYEEYESELKEWLLNVADHKMERFPSLNRVVLWVIPIEGHSGERQMNEVLMSLGMSTAFAKAGIELVVSLTPHEDIGHDFSTVFNHFLK